MPEYRDGFASLLNGMNEGIASDLLPVTQYAKGINISSRGGKVHTRPRWTELSASVPDGRFQGGITYHLDSTERIVFAVDGNVYGLNLENLTVTNYSTLAGVTFNATQDRLYFIQAEKYVIVQDGSARPMIIEDATAREADSTADEVPTGTKMAYGHGRLFIVVSSVGAATGLGERFFVAGDIMLPSDVSTLLKFTETNYLSGGGAMSLPAELGFITWMGFLKNAQTGSGLGALIVMAQGGSSAFAVNAQRVSWSEIDLSQVLFTGSGAYAPIGWTQVNNDLFYRSNDGLRTIGYSTSRASGQAATLSNTPMSREVQDVMALDDREGQGAASMIYVDNRILTTVNQQDSAEGPSYQGVVSIDTSVVSAFGQDSPAIYDGIWTGLNVTQLLAAIYDEKLRAVAFHQDGSENKVYYLNEDSFLDGSNSKPPTRLYTRSYHFMQNVQVGMMEHEFSEVLLWLSGIKGTVTGIVYYRPRGYPLWGATDSFTVCADMTASSYAQIRRHIKLTPTEDEYSDPATDDNLLFATDFEFCIQLTGVCQIDKAIFIAQNEQDDEQLGCDLDSSCVQLLPDSTSGIALDDYEYEVS